MSQRVEMVGIFGAWCLSMGLLFVSVLGCTGKGATGGPTVQIVSYQLRDRAMTLQNPVMRSSLIVGFRVYPGGIPQGGFSVEGELGLNGITIAHDVIPCMDSPTGTLCFLVPGEESLADRERPLSMGGGLYSIQLHVKGRDGRIVAEQRMVLRQSQLGRTFVEIGHEYPSARFIQDATVSGGPVSSQVLVRKDTQEFTLFAHSPLARMYSNSTPMHEAAGEVLTLKATAGETGNVVFSLRSIKALENVTINITLPRRGSGLPLQWKTKLGAVRDLSEDVTDDSHANTIVARRAPRLIEAGSVSVARDTTQSMWLSFRIESNAVPGIYRGECVVNFEKGRAVSVPYAIEVLPFTLPGPDITYGMMMDYAFYELDNPGWSERERKTLQRRGDEIYRDMREHGMTMAYPHSHFFYRTNDNGEPVLDSLRVALKSYREQGFPGPFVWYLGHLLNTAKPKHPGSILLYDEKVAERRLRDLLPRFEKIALDAGVSKEKLVVQLVDEPDREDRSRMQAARKLNAVAKELGFRTLITRPWPEVDIMCTEPPDDDREAARLRSMGNEWWIYPNEALTGRNLGYTRYVFGFGAWRWGVKGVVPWTYQMSQGCNGNPFTVLDGPEIMVTYPGVDGPITTPTWETIRDGINDYRYIHLLTTLIDQGKKQGSLVALRIEQQLTRFKASLGRPPGPAEGEEGDWPPDTFEKRREQIVNWILELSGQNSRPRQRAL